MVSDDITTTNQTIDFNAELRKPRLLAFVFAEWANGKAGEKYVVAGIFDKLLIPEKDLPASVNFFVYLRFAQVGGNSLRVNIYSPEGDLFGHINYSSEDTAPEGPHFLQSVLPVTMPISQAGTYWFEVMFLGERYGLIPLIVEAPVEKQGVHRDV